jgi:uncharacterized protein YebE (UPF0316 family)
MGDQLFLNSELFKWFILPLLIFVARVLDVSLGTLRVVFISKGMKLFAPLLGFFEILIWLLAIGQIFHNLSNVACYVAYAGGFAMGTFVGIYIENKLSIGTVIIRIITRKEASELIEFLKSADYGITSTDAQGATGGVKIIYSIIKRQDLKNVVEIIKKFNPHAFYTVEDVKFVSEGIFPTGKHWFKKNYFQSFRNHRKEK